MKSYTFWFLLFYATNIHEDDDDQSSFLESEHYNFLIGTSIKSAIYCHCIQTLKMNDSTNHGPNFILFQSVSTVHSWDIVSIKYFRVFLNWKPLFSIKFCSQRTKDLLSENNCQCWICIYVRPVCRYRFADTYRLRAINVIEIQFSMVFREKRRKR